MSFQPGAAVYTQGFATRPENVEVPHYDRRAPTTTDILYPVGKRWIDSVGANEYVLFSITTIAGVASANWGLLGGTSGALNTLTTDDSTVVTPTAGNINLAGTGSIATTGSGSTATIGLVNLTNHNVLVGAGTATITKVAPSATSGVPLISQGAAADPAFGTATVPGGGTGATTLTAHGVLLGEGTSAVVATTAGTNGQVLLGSTGADPAFGTLTSSTGVSFTTGAASLAINVATGGFAVTPVAGTSQALAVQTAYIANNASATTFTLPTTAAVGTQILISGGTANTAGWVIAQNANQTIHRENVASTTGVTGTATSAAHACESVMLMCVTANTDFVIMYSNGTITLA